MFFWNWSCDGFGKTIKHKHASLQFNMTFAFFDPKQLLFLLHIWLGGIAVLKCWDYQFGHLSILTHSRYYIRTLRFTPKYWQHHECRIDRTWLKLFLSFSPAITYSLTELIFMCYSTPSWNPMLERKKRTIRIEDNWNSSNPMLLKTNVYSLYWLLYKNKTDN